MVGDEQIPHIISRIFFCDIIEKLLNLFFLP